jgi:hypothetical protein
VGTRIGKSLAESLRLLSTSISVSPPPLRPLRSLSCLLSPCWPSFSTNDMTKRKSKKERDITEGGEKERKRKVYTQGASGEIDDGRKEVTRGLRTKRNVQ